MCDYYFVCGVQRNCGSSRHFAMCCTLQKFARYSSSVFIFFSFKWHCKLLIITLLIKLYSLMSSSTPQFNVLIYSTIQYPHLLYNLMSSSTPQFNVPIYSTIYSPQVLYNLISSSTLQFNVLIYSTI